MRRKFFLLNSFYTKKLTKQKKSGFVYVDCRDFSFVVCWQISAKIKVKILVLIT